jgi:dolichol-phosphate mannosyltransferase
MSEHEISVVLPVLREAENLPLLVPAIARALEPSGKTWSVIVVDDDSRDGTIEACESLRSTYPLQLVVRETERGLSGAVLEGFRRGGGRTLVVMDADLSHPPGKIPGLLAALDGDGVDFVIGSRFVAGGSTPADWGPLRVLNSKLATLLALPLTRVKDPMSGFFALRRQTLDSAAGLDPLGFKIGLELIVKCRCRNVREIPIDFRRRTHGQSKLSLRVQWSYLRHLLRLYRFKLLQAGPAGS